uniref:Uncharacterized protein n=1 Tax=Meloidogyne hapla TaxID=6305 RepID=A0A1I8BUT2_MELHA
MQKLEKYKNEINLIEDKYNKGKGKEIVDDKINLDEDNKKREVEINKDKIKKCENEIINIKEIIENNENNIEELKNEIFYKRFNIQKIFNMRKELAKGETRLLFTNCNRNQVIEALAFNVEIFCLPYRDDQNYVAEALKFNKAQNQSKSIFSIPLRFAKNLIKGNDKNFIQLSKNLSLSMNDIERLKCDIEGGEYYQIFENAIIIILEKKDNKIANKIHDDLIKKWKKKHPADLIIDVIEDKINDNTINDEINVKENSEKPIPTRKLDDQLAVDTIEPALLRALEWKSSVT